VKEKKNSNPGGYKSFVSVFAVESYPCTSSFNI